jgi:hypothetical protein
MLQNMVDEVVVNEDNDKWSYIWDSDRFSVKKTYKHLRGHQVTHQAFRWLWKCSCQNKHKVFFWLVLIDRVSTRELLKRKNMVLQDYTCVLCNGAIEESQTHLFLQCPFAMQCWGSINLQVQQHLDPFQNLQSFKDQLSEPFFMEVIVLMAWTIWKSRNDLIFRQIVPNLTIAKQNFNAECQLLLLRAKRSYFPKIEQWIANLS